MFCNLAETKSFTKTARINGVTQSAISQQISSLERQFQSTLVERSKKRFALTREGQALYDGSKQIMQAYDSMRHRLQEIKDIVTGSIRIVTIYSIGLHELPTYLKEFLRKRPTVNVSVEYRRASHVYEEVIGNVADIGLVAYPQSDQRLETVPLRNDLLVIICHPKHPLAGRQKLSLKALHGMKFIGFEPDIPTRRAIDHILRDRAITVNHVMEFDNIETVKRAVEIDAGVSIVPRNTVAQECAKKTITQLRIEDADFYRPLAAIYKRGKVLSPAMREFIDLLRA